jgi:glycosyltransferase involved in cell wall biosynthesis
MKLPRDAQTRQSQLRDMPVRIVADLRWPAGTGIGVVQRSLVDRAPDDVNVVDLDVRGRIGNPLSPFLISVALARVSAGTDVFWSPGFMPPVICRLPSVVTVHDLLHVHFYSRIHKAYYDTVLRPLYRRCSAIVCVSNFTRDQFLDWSCISPDRVFTIHNGVSDSFRAKTKQSSVGKQYILYPGNRRPYKNIGRLLRAYALSELPANDIHLAFTGVTDPTVQSEASRLGIARLVYFTGLLQEAELVRLYQKALVVVYVSIYEGFGLPVVEGMAAGVPVLASNTSAIPEVSGKAALLINPYSIDEMASGLNTLAFNSSERSYRIQLGQKQAARFSWDASAEKLWNLLRRVHRR